MRCGPADQGAYYYPSRTKNKFHIFLGPFLRAFRRTPTVPVLSVRTDCPSILFKQKKPTHTFRKIKYPREIGVRRAIQTYVLHLSVRRCLTAADKQKNSHEGGGMCRSDAQIVKKRKYRPILTGLTAKDHHSVSRQHVGENKGKKSLLCQHRGMK